MTCLLAALLAVSFACERAESDKITAGDFARVAPEFSALPAETFLGFAALPGGHRMFTGADVRRIAGQHQITSTFGDSICFEWPMRKLERVEVTAAIAEALGRTDATVEVENFSLFAVPEGKLVFPLGSLNRQPQGTALWRGYVQYGSEKRFNVWAKVRLPEIFDVRSGDRVMVLVENGVASLRLDGQAVSPGVVGQTVTVRNLRSGKLFAAEVTGKGSVRVDAGEPQK